MSPRRISRFRENLWELREFLHKWDLECAFLYFIQLRVSRVKQWRSPFSWVPTACCCFYMSMLRSMLILFFHFIVIFFSSIFYFDFKETTKTSMHIISCLLFPSSSRTFIITTLKFNLSVFPTAIPSHIIPAYSIDSKPHKALVSHTEDFSYWCGRHSIIDMPEI